jgi:hypothetical protein
MLPHVSVIMVFDMQVISLYNSTVNSSLKNIICGISSKKASLVVE